jgi:hypothetical protein
MHTKFTLLSVVIYTLERTLKKEMELESGIMSQQVRGRRRLLIWITSILLIMAWISLLIPASGIQKAPSSGNDNSSQHGHSMNNHQPKLVTGEAGVLPTIVFVINTHDKNYLTRVQNIRETWMKRVLAKPSMHMFFVGSQGHERIPNLVHSQCKLGYWEDSCKRGDMQTFAYNFLVTAEGQYFDWVFFGDDDHYILPDNLQRMIMSLGPDAVNETKAWGIPACKHDNCVGFCGGAGYFTNRNTLIMSEERTDRTKFSNFRNETDIYDAECGRCGDLVIAKIWNERRNVTLEHVPKGAYVWDFPNGEDGLLESLKSSDPLPWLYHYPAKNRQHWMQEKVDEFGSNKEFDG